MLQVSNILILNNDGGHLMKNKRRGPDFIIKVIGWISLFSWVTLISVISILIISNPALRGLTLVKMPAKQISQGWLSFIYVMFILLIIINICGIIFNFIRLKRKTDNMRLTFFFSVIVAVIGLILLNN